MGDAARNLGPSVAEAAFLQFLQLEREGRAPDFPAFCAGRPDLAGELHRLMQGWEETRPLLASLFEGADPAALLSRLALEPREEGAAPVALERAERTLPPNLGRGPSGGGAAARLPERLLPGERYEDRELVDAGGMGLIHRAWDRTLHRHVALKVLRAAEEWSDQPPGAARDMAERIVTSRFLDEALLTAQLDHPGIVPVHDLGLDADGRLFFSMKLVKGDTLRTVLDKVAAGEDGWTTNRMVSAVLRVCEAVAYAHSKGVIHRDIKPANIMVGRFGQVLLMDWGLARLLDAPPEAVSAELAESAPTPSALAAAADSPVSGGAVDDSWLFTQDGRVLGTPVYMSPEQALGDIERVDERTDIYSLGALLWHLLTGRMPWVAPGEQPLPFVVLMRVREGGLPAVTAIAPEAPPTLVAICERAMARDPAARYATAADMAAELQDYLEDISDDREEARRQARRAQRLNDFLIGMLSAHDPAAARGRDVTVAEVLERSAAAVGEQLAGHPQDEADVRATLGRLFLATGRLAEAEAQLLRAVELLDQWRGAEDRETLQARTELAVAWRRLGHGPQGVAHLREILDTQRRVLGERDETTLRTADLLACSLFRVTRDIDEAEALYREVIAARRVVLGPRHRDTLTAMGSLGQLLRVRGRNEEALALQQEVVAELRATVGADHPDTLVVLVDLANALHACGRGAEAEQVIREVSALQERVLGNDHPDLLITRNNLGLVLIELGRAAEAEPMLAAIAARHAELAGAAHPSSLNLRQSHALALLALGRAAQAETEFVALVTDAAAALGDRHLLVARFRHNHGRALVALGRRADARRVLEEVGEVYASRLAPEDVWRVQLSADLGAART